MGIQRIHQGFSSRVSKRFVCLAKVAIEIFSPVVWICLDYRGGFNQKQCGFGMICIFLENQKRSSHYLLVGFCESFPCPQLSAPRFRCGWCRPYGGCINSVGLGAQLIELATYHLN